MWTSTKRYIRTPEGEVVEAGPGVSGTLVVAAGSQLREDDAIKLGLLASTKGQPAAKANESPKELVTEGRSPGEMITAAAKKKPWIDDAGKERTDEQPAAGLSLGAGTGDEDKVSPLPKKVSFGAGKKDE
jgi:hypothetical protein